MKVLNLRCALGHSFEGWFAGEEAFQDQLVQGLVECPMCGDTAVEKMLSAPRLMLGSSDPSSAALSGNEPRNDVAAAGDATMQAAWMKMARHVMANTEDVGNRFPEEARRIHYGEVEQRGIRGQASARETAELVEEGIGVLPLPLPKAMKGPMQ